MDNENEIFIPSAGINKINEFLSQPMSEMLYGKMSEHIHQLEQALKQFNEQIQPKTRWSKRLSFFPFNIKIIQRILLKIYRFLFREQQRMGIGLKSLSQAFVDIIVELYKQQCYLLEHLQIQKNNLTRNQQEQTTVSQQIKSLKEEIAFQRRNVVALENLLNKKEGKQEITAIGELNQSDKIQKIKYAAIGAAITRNFRGSIELIQNRQSIYLPYIINAQAGSTKFPVLDIACGRGEWLDLLRKEKIHAIGIDSNSLLVENCKALDLLVEEVDMFAYLSATLSNSIGSITAFHIIEHLSFEEQIKFLEEVFRVTREGGVVIFETPNPENLYVSAYTFYLDPTHKNPLPSLTLKVLLEQVGFKNLQILPLAPGPEHNKIAGSDLSEYLNRFFSSAQDYAIIGYK